MRNVVYNMDCMRGMKEYPDKYFDLAIVDPVYGGVTKGGYMTHNRGQYIGTGKARQKGYHSSLWQQEKTPPRLFQRTNEGVEEPNRMGRKLFCLGTSVLAMLGSVG